MYVDSQLEFSDGQAVTAAAESTNIIDLSIARDIAVGEQLYVAINVTVAMTDSGSDSTLTVDAYYDSTETMTPDAQQRLLIIPALSAIGFQVYVPLSPHLSTTYRYLALQYTPNSGNLTTGTFDAQLVWDIQKNIHYANNSLITS